MLSAFCSPIVAQSENTVNQRRERDSLDQLLEVAKAELTKAKLSAAEVRLRLAIVKNVATVKSYFPHADGGRPEMRNTKYWMENDDGYFVPRGKPTEAIKDLWRTTSGIRCHKLSTLVMLKGLIDISDDAQLARLDEQLRGKVIPTDLTDEGIGEFFEWQREDDGYSNDGQSFLAGDEVWFDNPYFDRLKEREQSRYRGQEGHHVFYVGGGQVMDMYSRVPEPIDEFRKSFLSWSSVRKIAEREQVEPTVDDFVIKEIRRAKVQP